jgi:outer membrane protein OmpA-like peptidoglycan-associated protein
MKRFIQRAERRKRFEVWQIIYMDLMTIVMVFFVILWSINIKSTRGIDEAVGEQTVRMVTLPGDVLFASGKWFLTDDGKKVFVSLFQESPEQVLNFDTGGLVRRRLVIHGHTDSDGEKDENLLLGYQRAYSVYKEIQKYGPDLGNHIILCTHADNSPAQEVPVFEGATTKAQKIVLRDAKSKNRRIAIEDQLVGTQSEAGEAR